MVDIFLIRSCVVNGWNRGNDFFLVDATFANQSALETNALGRDYIAFCFACAAARGKFRAKSVVFSSTVSSRLRVIDIICCSPQQMAQASRSALMSSDKSSAARWISLSAAVTR